MAIERARRPAEVTEDGAAVLSRGVAGGSQGAVVDLAAVPKAGRSVGSWTPKEVAGRTVYQRKDIFDPLKASSWQDPVTGRWKRGSNLDRMSDGLAPIARDGKSVNLHHVLQGEPGPMAEVPSILHKSLPHKLRGAGESFRNDPVLKRQFEEWRGEYWKERSRDLRPGN